ncbi:MAG TPA: hypothetical protein VIF62_16900, partial [Labilithrix sp.]
MGRLHEATWKLAACGLAALSAFCAPPRRPDTAIAPPAPAPSLDPRSESASLAQSPMVHVFDTHAIAGGPFYVNDHSLVHAPDGQWHLFGIFHSEPMGPDTEVEL